MDRILQSLFQALARDPQEEAIRWILADRLEELGFDQQAQFIRIQCQLAQLQGPPAFFSGDFLYTQLNWQPRDRSQVLSIDPLTVDDYCSYYEGTVHFRVSISVWRRAGEPGIHNTIGIQINDQTTSYQMRFLASINVWQWAPLSQQVDVQARVVPWSYLGAGHEEPVHWFNLKEQENQLLKDNERLGNPWIALAGPLYYPNYYLDYERGFVKTLCLPCDTFVQLARQIFTYQPVIQTVLLSDCQPYCLTNEEGQVVFYSWHREGENTSHSRYRPSCLPPVLFDRLASSDDPVSQRYFLRQENAINALSAVCIAHGREQALIYQNGSLSSV